MYTIPGSLLERVYVKDSLRNTAEGFEFALKNVVDSGTLTRLMALEVDGQAIPLEQVTIVTEEKQRPATEITPNAPMYFPLGRTMTVRVAGTRLEPGEHKLSLRINTWEAGAVTVPITAVLREEPEK